MELKYLLYIFILVTAELLTVSSLKYWTITKNNIFLYLGILGYIVVGGIFAYILYIHSELTIINSLWQVLNIILVSAIGLMIYKEKINTWQSFGVALAIISSVLLSIE